MCIRDSSIHSKFLIPNFLIPNSLGGSLCPNAVSYTHLDVYKRQLFAAAGSAGRRGELDHLPGPLLGWAGTIHADLDLTPILYAAQARPAWTFLLLGRREENPLLRRLSRLSNVMLAGPCPLVEVPDYLGRCQEMCIRDRSCSLFSSTCFGAVRP